MMLKDSKDPQINKAGISTRTCRKWKAHTAVEQAGSRLKHKYIVGTTTVEIQELGFNPRSRWITSSEKERKKHVQDEITQQCEEDRQLQAAGMAKQGSWLN
eukprot:GHVR01072882.1.p1 GENE.GHVR01072882.1~~GHVR01072882.1.p1  ORF type:complete len:101 (+),score=12.06 GHVR01072882.1:634-936(+)